MAQFKDIKKFPFCTYLVDVSLRDTEINIARFTEEYQLDFEPAYQRGYVWFGLLNRK
jgi:hypothetical protein